MMARPRYLFVYGTLRSGARGPAQERLMRGLRLVGRASIPGRVYDTGPYPVGTPPVNDADRIVGELYAMDADADALLAALDEYEGIDAAHPDDSLFMRLAVDAMRDDGTRTPTWVYLFNGSTDGLPRVPSGDWLAP